MKIANHSDTSERGIMRSVHIDDLHNPVLTDEQVKEEKKVSGLRVEMSKDAVLAAARERTGLCEFGPEDFVDRLDSWLEEVDASEGRSKLGRVMAFRRCVRWVSNRLKLNDLLKRHPEVFDISIKEPIIIVGYPRAGTTQMVNILAQNRTLRSLPVWESYDPFSLSGKKQIEASADPRYIYSAEKWNRACRMLPFYASLHNMEPSQVTEEIELQGGNCAPGLLATAAHVPNWAARYRDTDHSTHYEYMKTGLKALQWLRGPERWVLKCPYHVEQIRPLMATFPDAKIVMMHRDPAAIIASTLTMVTYLARLEFKGIDIASIRDFWVSRIVSMLYSGTHLRDVVPESQIIDVYFDQFMQDNIKEARKIWEFAGIEMNTELLVGARSWIESNRRNNVVRIAHDLENDFDISADEIRARLRQYYEYYPVEIES